MKAVSNVQVQVKIMIGGELMTPFNASVAADALTPDTSSPSPRTIARNAKIRNGVRPSGPW